MIRDRSLSSVLLLTLYVPLRGGEPGRLAADVSRSPKGLVVSHLLSRRGESLGEPGGLSAFAGTRSTRRGRGGLAFLGSARSRDSHIGGG